MNCSTRNEGTKESNGEINSAYILDVFAKWLMENKANPTEVVKAATGLLVLAALQIPDSKMTFEDILDGIRKIYKLTYIQHKKA